MRFARFASISSRFFANHSSSVSLARDRHTFLAKSSLGKYLAPARYLTIALFILAAAIPAFSQSDRGTIAGTILDSSGGAVQGATITATNANTGAVYKITSTDTGSYRIPD